MHPGSAAAPGHLLFCHGQRRHTGDRLLDALLSAAGFNVLLLDYRRYGDGTGMPDEQDTYRVARAVLAAVLERPAIDPDQLL